MQRGITELVLVQTDLLGSIEAANQAGYDALELRASVIADFLAQGHRADEVRRAFEAVSVRPHAIGVIENIDLPESASGDGVVAFCHQMCAFAEEIRCPNVQVLSGTTLAGKPWATICKETATGLRRMADIASGYGITLVYEPLAWRPVRRVEQAVEIIAEANRPNIGVLLDTFHIFAGGDDLEMIRQLDPRLMPTVHKGDAVASGRGWSDADRYVMPGDGIVPLQEILRAILDTGYNGVISDEVLPRPDLGKEPGQVARLVKAKGDAILQSVYAASH